VGTPPYEGKERIASEESTGRAMEAHLEVKGKEAAPKTAEGKARGGGS
jgi:hypothetical protein